MYQLNDWRISDNGLSADDVLQNGNRLLTGNGYIGRRGVVDEADASAMPATIIAGLYDRQGDLWREPVNAPDPLYTLFSINGKPLRAGDDSTISHEQELDFRYGIYSRSTSWRIPANSPHDKISGTVSDPIDDTNNDTINDTVSDTIDDTNNDTVVTLKACRYAHMEDVHLLAVRYEISSSRPCALILKQGINRNVRDLNGPHVENYCFSNPDNDTLPCILGFSCTTQEQKIPLAVSSVLIPVSGDISLCESENDNDNEGFVFYKLNLNGKDNCFFYIYGTIFSGLDISECSGAAEPEQLQSGKFSASEVINAAQKCITKTLSEGWDSLLQKHYAKWESIWRTGDVVIEGDDYAQRCLRYSLYHLWIITPRHCSPNGRALSVPARGLSGQTYKGAIFWDTEMFIAPYFLAVNPALAANFIRYRIQTLPGAKRKAAYYGYRGAFYAWESQESGDDACSDFNVTDVFTGRPVRTFFRDKQIHISADIVYSVKNYIDYTGDYSILSEGAMEMILEAARFFLSYLYYSPERKRYEVLDVIGPDEYHERVNNNAFTNRMVYFVFEISTKYTESLRKTNLDFIDALFKRLDFSADFEFMKTVMKQFYLPLPDERGVIEQFDGYFRLEDCTLDEVKSRLKDPREYWGGGNGVASSTMIIKQADVVSMLAIFGDRYSMEIKQANLCYYEPRTEHGSSLSSCMYALLSCDTGDGDHAYPYLIKSAEIDITGKSKHFAGLVYIGGTHPAANGGAWLTAIRGFCGLSIEGNSEIKIKPCLPALWKSVKFSLIIAGVEHEILVTKDGYTICKK